jgi:hypothetical protein
MTKRVEKLLARSLAVLAYALPVGLSIWRNSRNKSGAAQPKATATEAAPMSSTPRQALETLSLSTPGDAALDRLARIAEREQQHEDYEPRHRTTRPPDARSIEELLQHQSLESGRLEGWSLPEPQRLPIPTFAPAVMAFGIVVFAMGLATVWYVCAAGSLVFALAAWRWVGELQGE